MPGEKIEDADKNHEKIEEQTGAESRQEEELIKDLAKLRTKVAASQPAAAPTGRQTKPDDDIEARKEKIVNSLVKIALAANFAEDKVAHIMCIAEKYIRKDYPDIADEIHDRILEAKNKGM
ncbi:MAG: hypothetical protein PHU53_07870 [Thermoplasmata archaeon]|nr:hypothetical protein [Thermoplasmata archaeon]